MTRLRRIKRNLCFSDGGQMLPPPPVVTRALKWAFALLLGLAITLTTAIMVWVTHPSRMYYKPVSASVYQAEDGRWMARVTRELPMGDIWARWRLTVWVSRGEASFVCGEPFGHPIQYDAQQGPTIEYELPPSVSRCMDSAPPISLTWTRQVMAWGWFPLKPVETTTTITSDVVPSREDA